MRFICIHQEEGYNYKNKIIKLKKAIYDIKTGTSKMNIRFMNFLIKKDFNSISNEQCLFKKKNNEIIFGIYVDDELLIESDIEDKQDFEKIIK